MYILYLTAHLNLDPNFASEILDLCLDFTKCTAEKGLHTQSVLNILN